MNERTTNMTFLPLQNVTLYTALSLSPNMPGRHELFEIVFAEKLDQKYWIPLSNLNRIYIDARAFFIFTIHIQPDLEDLV